MSSNFRFFGMNFIYPIIVFIVALQFSSDSTMSPRDNIREKQRLWLLIIRLIEFTCMAPHLQWKGIEKKTVCYLPVCRVELFPWNMITNVI